MGDIIVRRGRRAGTCGAQQCPRTTSPGMLDPHALTLTPACKAEKTLYISSINKTTILPNIGSTVFIARSLHVPSASCLLLTHGAPVLCMPSLPQGVQVYPKAAKIFWREGFLSVS